MSIGIWQVSPAIAQLPDEIVQFLTITDAPRANSMGNCGINLVDEQSALHNPGALGLFFFDHRASFSVPGPSGRLLNRYRDLTIKTSSVAAGVSADRLNWLPPWVGRVSIGAAYSQRRLSMGSRYSLEDYRYGRYSLYQPTKYESAEMVTMSIGLETADFRLGVGVTRKGFYTQVEGTDRVYRNAATDWGVLLELPLMGMTPVSQPGGAVESDWTYVVTPSIAFVSVNMGVGFSNDADFESLFENKFIPIDEFEALNGSHTSRLGVSLYVAKNYGPAAMLSGQGFMQWDLSVGFPRPSESESILPGQVIERNNVLSQSLPASMGIEIGILDIAFIRAGRHPRFRQFKHQSISYTNTWGYGLSLQGLLTFLNARTGEGSGSVLEYLYDHVEFRYDRVHREPSTRFPQPDESEFMKFALSIR